MLQPVLRVQLLGGFSLIFNEAVVSGVFPARLQSLLAYLVVHADVPQSRQHLAFFFWPDTTEPRARNNLRQCLFQLRQALPDSQRFLVADTNTIYWKTDGRQIIDLQHFEDAVAAADAAEQRGDKESCRRWLEQAVSAYQGDLLPGCYDEWILPERERLRQMCYLACQRLVHALEAQRDYTTALVAAQQMLRLDPLDEVAYLTLMRLHVLNGDGTAARRVYQTALETVQGEFGVEAGNAIRTAYNHLQHYAPQAVYGDGNVATISYQLVGRQTEWQRLQAAWQQAANGRASFVLITGEAGIGKSRLVEELYNWTRSRGVTSGRTRSYATEGRLSLAPVTEWLRSDSLRPHLASLDPIWLTEIARLLPELLSENRNLAHPEPISEYGRRQRFLEALARGVLVAPRPTLLWIDDLQWCDQETLEWLHFLLRFEPHNPLLILGTARSDESPQDHPLSALTRQLWAEDKIAAIELAPLDAAETASLASQVLGESLDDSVTIRLYRETEGNPLFVVEAVRAGLDQLLDPGANSMTPAHQIAFLPPRVQAVITGRLAQLTPNAHKVAEVAAAIGRDFTLDLLLRCLNEDDETVIGALNELWQRRIVREQTANVFDFTHDKLREVAYAETSVPRRRLIHRHIARALEAINAENLAPVSPQIAVHYEQAGLIEQAIPFYQRAGAHAATVYANEEAINLFGRGLALLEGLPQNKEREAQELDLLLALATLYRVSRGWASPEEERVMNRVMVLSDRVGDVEQRIRTLFGLQTLYVVQAQYEKVERTYLQLEKLFWEMQGTPPPPFVAINLAGARLFTGELTEARALFEKVVAVRDDKWIRDLQESQGLNYLVHGLAWNSHALWCLGYPQLALNSAQTAITLASEYAQPFNQALAITYLAMLQLWRADQAAFWSCAEDAYALTEACEAPYYHAWATILKRFALVAQQPEAANLANLREAIQRFIDTGAQVRLPVYHSLLAAACLKTGRWDEGLAAVQLALTESLQNNEHWWDAEIYRIRGEIMWAQGADPGDVAADFERALAIAQTQHARSLALRAATSLAQLQQANGRLTEARELLTPLYESFSEGFDTPDLQKARALMLSL